MSILLAIAFVLSLSTQVVGALVEFPSNDIVLPSIKQYESRFTIQRISIRREWRDSSYSSLNGVAATFAIRKPYNSRDIFRRLDNCIGTMNDTGSL
jgi:hypothetical protein